MRDYHSHHASLNPQSQSVSLIISPVISGLHVDIISRPFTKYITFNTFFDNNLFSLPARKLKWKACGPKWAGSKHSAGT